MYIHTYIYIYRIYIYIYVMCIYIYIVIYIYGLRVYIYIYISQIIYNRITLRSDYGWIQPLGPKEGIASGGCSWGSFTFLTVVLKQIYWDITT